jgi:hypothetical protein
MILRGEIGPEVAAAIDAVVCAIFEAEARHRAAVVDYFDQVLCPEVWLALLKRLVEVLLSKDGAARQQAREALACFGSSALPFLDGRLMKSRRSAEQVLLIDLVGDIGAKLPPAERLEVFFSLSAAAGHVRSARSVKVLGRAYALLRAGCNRA